MVDLMLKDLGSSCCGARVIDPGNTGEGLCSDCKKHCSKVLVQQISIMVLTTDGAAHHHVVDYNPDDDPDYDMDERIQNYVDDLYNTNDCWFVYSTTNVLKFTDHDQGGGTT